MPDLGRAYVSIIPKAEGISNQISNIVTPGATAAGNKGGSALSRGLSRGIDSVGGVITKFAATGASTIAGIAGSISGKAFGGGLARAMAIDEASAKFKQLGFNWDKGTTNMKNSILASVKDTKYGLDEMAGVAVNFASTGIKAGDGMTKALQSVASAASISGVDIDHMGAIYTKVAAAGKLTGGVMQQLQENGINANAALQKALGKSSEDISKMVTKGEIDFETFSTAMRDYFGDAAESANSTFSGASANVRAALSRMGAAFTGPVMESIRKVFAGEGFEGKGLMGAIDNIAASLQPLADRFAAFAETVGQKVGLALERFNKYMAAGSTPLGAFLRALVNAGGPLENLGNWFDGLSESMQSVILKVGKVGGIIAGGAAGMGVLSGAIGSLVPGLGSLIGGLGGAGGAFGLVSKAGNMLFGTISSLVGGGGLGGLPGPLSALTGPLGIAAGLFAAMFASSDEFRGAVIGLVKTIISSLVPVIQSLVPTFRQTISIVMQVVTMLAGQLAPVIAQLTPVIGAVISSVGRLFTTLAGALLPVIQAVIPAVQNVLGIVLPVVTSIVETVLKALSKIINIVSTVLGRVISVVVPALSKVYSVVSSILGKVRAVFRKIWGAVTTVVSGAVNKIKGVITGISSVVGKVRNTFNKVKEAMQRPVEKVRDAIKKIVEKIKGFFKFKFPTPHIPKPHFGITPAGWKVSDLLKGKIPKLSIKWAAEGGIMNTPTLVGAGEAGREALLPLDPFWNRLDKIADNTGGQEITMYNTFNISGAEDSEAVVATVASKLKVAMRAI